MRGGTMLSMPALCWKRSFGHTLNRRERREVFEMEM